MNRFDQVRESLIAANDAASISFFDEIVREWGERGSEIVILKNRLAEGSSIDKENRALERKIELIKSLDLIRPNLQMEIARQQSLLNRISQECLAN